MTDNFDVAATKLTTHYGEFDLYCFSWGQHEEDNTLCLVKETLCERPLVRVQSACYTAEIFRSIDCDCHEQLEMSLKLIQEFGGILIYMLCDGRGAGLFKKVEGLELGRVHGLDTSAAYTALGLPQDPREYSRVASVLKHLNAKRVSLLTNNPRKVQGLIENGIDVSREPIEIASTDHSLPYLKTKALKMGHKLSEFNAKPDIDEATL